MMNSNILTLSLLFISYSLNAAVLEPETIVKRSLGNYPVVIDALNQLDGARAENRSAKGFYDLKLKGNTDSRLDGFYTGDAYKIEVEQTLPAFNSKLYAGFRDSAGFFPSYEGKSETLSDGEKYIGISLSLLRQSIFDVNRLNLLLASENVKQAESKLNLIKLKVQTMSLLAYWNWAVSVERVKVYQEILNLALVRMKGIKRRIQKGDLARIYRAENRQYIVKRKAQLEKAKYMLNEATLFLSLFNRDSNGQPMLPLAVNAPSLSKLKHPKFAYSKELLTDVLSKNLDLRIYNSKIKQTTSKVKLARINTLPKLDLSFEINEDSGMGDPKLQGQEQRLWLNFEFPFQNRKATGKRDMEKAKLNSLKAQRGLMVDELKRDLNSLVLKINTFSDLIDLTKEQVSLSSRLVSAEQRKFNSGASDLILLNLREEALAESKIKNLNTFLDYFSLNAKLMQTKVEFMVD